MRSAGARPSAQPERGRQRWPGEALVTPSGLPAGQASTCPLRGPGRRPGLLPDLEPSLVPLLVQDLLPALPLTSLQSSPTNPHHPGLPYSLHTRLLAVCNSTFLGRSPRTSYLWAQLPAYTNPAPAEHSWHSQKCLTSSLFRHLGSALLLPQKKNPSLLPKLAFKLPSPVDIQPLAVGDRGAPGAKGLMSTAFSCPRLPARL